MGFHIHIVVISVVSLLSVAGCGQVTLPAGAPDASTADLDAAASSDGAAEDAVSMDAASPSACDSGIALIYIDHLAIGVNADGVGGIGLFVWSVIENDSPVDVSLSGLSVTNVTSSANGPTFEIRPGDELSLVSIAAHQARGNLIPESALLIQPLIGTEWNDDTTIMVLMGSNVASSETAFFVTADVMMGDLLAPISIRVDTEVGPLGFSLHSARRICFSVPE